MDRAAEVAIKAVILGLYRSKAISAQHVAEITAELGYAATHLNPPDRQASTDIETMARWMENAVAHEDVARGAGSGCITPPETDTPPPDR